MLRAFIPLLSGFNTSQEDTRKMEVFIEVIQIALENEPIESCVEHDAEQLLSEYLEVSGEKGLFDAFEGALGKSQSLAADFLRVLGRSSSLSSELRKDLVSRGLSSESVDVREAAVRAVGNWNDSDLASELRAHSGCEQSGWLRQFAIKVTNRLEG